uniref:Putative major capsid protein n=1 Tax=Gokushovirinae environmental samples TaxID=1478972 RepID=A0A2R3UAG3_9VIRU|nr:putative major capsid protein [Gokushovirinae environmental samples]
MPLQSGQQKSVNLHKFAMVPRTDIPRSRFNRQHKLSTTFDAGYLVPIFVDEMLPGDTFSIHMTGFLRTASPMLYPIMDNLHITTFFFFVPNRLVWTNWVKMMGERDNPSDSISYTVPTCTSPATGYAVNSLQDYLGLPTVGQLAGSNTYTHNNLIPRAYNQIYNAWFRSEDLQNSVTKDVGDGPDTAANYVLLRRGKRYDYFTGALPNPQKGATAVSLPLGTSAPVYGTGKALGIYAGGSIFGLATDGAAKLVGDSAAYNTNVGTAVGGSALPTSVSIGVTPGLVSGLYADLTTATAATINTFRLAMMTQVILERDARGGTRYTEMNWAHFGVQNPDARLQRPEYLGGSTNPIIVNPTVQTSGTSASGTTTALGQLAGITQGKLNGNHGFTYSATEHGHVIGLMCVDADLSYQQGVRKMWNRQTRYDFYLPGFAALGEQAILNRELYADGSANDTAAFGYIGRWDELRYFPSMITGLFRSTATGTLDAYHLAQKFTSLPTLNDTFIKSTPPLDRVLAVSSQTGKQFIFDSFWQHNVTRALPMYGVPATLGRF